MGIYEYYEFGSKNQQGGFNNLNANNKVVRQFENTSGSGVCHVRILDKYLVKISPGAKEADVFYLTPVRKLTDSSKPWFTKVPVRKNHLNSMMKEMCSQKHRIYKSQFKSVWSYILVSGKSPRKAYPTTYRSQKP